MAVCAVLLLYRSSSASSNRNAGVKHKAVTFQTEYNKRRKSFFLCCSSLKFYLQQLLWKAHPLQPNEKGRETCGRPTKLVSAKEEKKKITKKKIQKGITLGSISIKKGEKKKLSGAPQQTHTTAEERGGNWHHHRHCWAFSLSFSLHFI